MLRLLQGTSLQGVGLSDGDCGVVEVVVGEVTSSGRGEGDGLWVVVEGGCEDDGVGCEVWDGGMVVDILVGYPSSPIRKQVKNVWILRKQFKMHKYSNIVHVYTLLHTPSYTWTDRAADTRKMYRFHTFNQAWLRKTEGEPLRTGTICARVSIWIPTGSILMSLSIMFTLGKYWCTDNYNRWRGRGEWGSKWYWLLSGCLSTIFCIEKKK